jgi:hypothetical protein
MHTLGPWQYDINPNASEAIIIDREGYTVVELSALEHSTCASDLEDNTRLIAAAPDMLKALTQTLNIAINYACEARQCNLDECESWPWVQRARAAIAKATLESV